MALLFSQTAPRTQVLDWIEVIESAIAKLRSQTEQSVQATWHQCLDLQDLSSQQVIEVGDTWEIANLNERHHIPWPRGQRQLWLYQRIQVPPSVQHYPIQGHWLRLGLTWWADLAEIFVNGERVQTGDLFECFTRILLSDDVQPGDSFDLALHLISPGHDDGALVRSQLVYEAPESLGVEPGFVADELAVLTRYLEKLAPELLETVVAAMVGDRSKGTIAPLDWSHLGNQPVFLAELQALRQRLLPLSDWIKQRELVCVGHAHLDLAWLWPLEETWDAAQRTFTSVLELQQSFPELTYTHSSPALFQWLEDNEPALFQAAQSAVRQGWWAIDAGLWVEPELNTLGGESLARQILYGQRYCQTRFGSVSSVAWLPDSFGFSGQLPQLFRQGEIRYFATQKLRWNDTTIFPHHLFWWRGLDGTDILSLTLPPIGSDIDPVAMAEQGALWEQHTGLSQALWLPGMGDHGGGPTRDMLEKARRWSRSPFFPRLTFGQVATFLQGMEPGPEASLASLGMGSPNSMGTDPGAGKPGESPALETPEATLETPEATLETPDTNRLPVWRDELYLELHRGCYTTHADQKWYNRRCEITLGQAELWAAIATLVAHHPYPQAELETAWKQALFNQFHDILPGTAIAPVFATANQGWQQSLEIGEQVWRGAIAALLSHLTHPPAPHPEAIPIAVFNSLNWNRSEVVELGLPGDWATGHWQVMDGAGQILPSQRSQRRHVLPPGCLGNCDRVDEILLFPATNLPSVGYGWYWLVPQDGPVTVPPTPASWQLENEFLIAVIDPQSGDLVKLWDRREARNAIAASANQIQGFQDAGQYWDAWNIDPNYKDHPLPPTLLKDIAWIESGPLRQRLRVVRQLGQSTFQQDYVLDQGSPLLKVETVADWRETQVVVKAAFPLTVTATEATYEIPFGAIARPIQSPDPHQGAKWEVSALRWADLSDGDYGVAVLTDYKHGFDATPQQLRLTLLKAPLWPDPETDRGCHGFSYALFPHPGDWRQGRTPHQAIAFSQPLQAILVPEHDSFPVGPSQSQPSPAPLTQSHPFPECESRIAPHRHSFLSLGTEAVALAALKQAEDGEGWILRCWDLYGQGGELQPETAWGIDHWTRTNLLEISQDMAHPHTLAPWTIATYRLG
ncbi:alpha-mannosidase [Leptolyngbya sp. PCC 6406]|uniref:alpha-mannosidase n=1 Tax=Leptolyngbya sp. PCC 6406 TaxID=1173264 RepID=UPI0002AC7498|nr:alpha-mannosidase [Leptolyngbya sp. PCC 6406]